MADRNIELSIVPPTSIYGTYKRLTYTIWHAIAEFVDNSTASYYANRQILEKNPMYKFKVYIIYTSSKNAGDCKLEIRDNAYGMEIEDFKRAIVLNSPPLDKSGRNEFGMGLKTAASWFGNKWTVTSTRYNSVNRYTATVDIDELEERSPEKILINTEIVDQFSSGTILEIEKLNVKITDAKRQKVINQIASIYRIDLDKNNIDIIYAEKVISNGEIKYKYDGKTYDMPIDVPPLKYERPKIWKYHNHLGQLLEYKKEFNDVVIFENMQYPINGFVAIRETGDRRESGFTLIRRNRVIKGGPDSNYRPSEIFGSPSSFAYLRLFGEVNMDSWPVTQAKNDFEWNNGLEETFIAKMIEISKEYVDLSNNKLRVRGNIEKDNFSSELIQKMNNEVAKMLNESPTSMKLLKVDMDKPPLLQQNSRDSLPNDDIIQFYSFSLQDGVKTKLIDLHFVNSFSKQVNQWMQIEQLSKNADKYELKATLYLNHAFFKPYIDDENFLGILRKFSTALAVSAIECTFNELKNVLNYNKLLLSMNQYLNKFKNS